MTDERKSRPSASGIEQMQLCPGSWRAQQGLLDTPNADSESGDRIHAALAGDIDALNALSSDELSIYEVLSDKAAMIAESLGFPADARRVVEERLWYYEPNSVVFSGKADRIYLHDREALIVDFKSGWNEVEEAAGNPQMAALAVLLKAHSLGDSLWKIHVGIIPANAKATIATYDAEALLKAELTILHIIAEADKENAQRIPGDKQCRYCRARNQCPERLAQKNALEPVQRLSLPALSPTDLAGYLGKLPAIKKIISDLESEAKARIERGEDVPGYALKAGSPREVIGNLPVIHARCEKLGINTEQFTDACSLTKTAAKEMIQRATGKKGKALDTELDSLISGCTKEGKAPEPSLVKSNA